MSIVQQIASVVAVLIADAAERQTLTQLFSNAAESGLVANPTGYVSIGFAGGPRVRLITGKKWDKPTETALKQILAAQYGKGKLQMSNIINHAFVTGTVFATVEDYQKAVAAGTAAKASSGRKNDPAVVEDIKARLLAARDEKAAGQTVTAEPPAPAANHGKQPVTSGKAK